MSEAIGIMEGAFFVSKGEIIQWINEAFLLDVTKIEQLGSGAVYCQILDAIHPGKVNMSKVNWKAHLEWEFINNLKILQQAFLKCGLNKHIEVERLAKAKYQDNLEFAQWMKRYYDINHGTKDYDPVARRYGVNPNFSGGDKQPSRIKEDKTTTVRHRSKERVGARHEGKARTESMPKKTRAFTLEKDSSKEIKTLYQYLMSMKAIAEGKEGNNGEKIDKISELIDNSLKLAVFEDMQYLKKGNKGMIEKIEEKENY